MAVHDGGIGNHGRMAGIEAANEDLGPRNGVRQTEIIGRALRMGRGQRGDDGPAIGTRVDTELPVIDEEEVHELQLPLLGGVGPKTRSLAPIGVGRDQIGQSHGLLVVEVLPVAIQVAENDVRAEADRLGVAAEEVDPAFRVIHPLALLSGVEGDWLMLPPVHLAHDARVGTAHQHHGLELRPAGRHAAQELPEREKRESVR